MYTTIHQCNYRYHTEESNDSNSSDNIEFSNDCNSRDHTEDRDDSNSRGHTEDNDDLNYSFYSLGKKKILSVFLFCLFLVFSSNLSNFY